MAPPPSSVQDFATLLYKCSKQRDLAQALHLHDVFMSQTGLDAHGSLLVSVLVELDSVCHARHIFDRMVYRDAPSYNALIVGYVKQNEPQHALTVYHKMHEVQDHSIHPNDYAFVALLKACATLKELNEGQHIHVEAARLGLLESNVFVGCSLVDMYAKCGYMSTAQETFKALPIRDTVSWNALINGYTELGYGIEALECLAQMHHDGVSGNSVTYICCLKACGSIGDVPRGQEIYAEVLRQGLESDPLIGNTLVDMYARCGVLVRAKVVFDNLLRRDVVSWNTLLGGLVEHGHCKEALAFSEQMKHAGICLSHISFTFILKACSSVGSSEKGLEIHTEIVTRGLECEPYLGSSLVDLYAKCGLLLDAQQVLHRLPNRSVASWTALMVGYAEHGHGEEVLDFFGRMRNEGIPPDAFTFSCSLKACGSIGATEAGQELHAEIAGKGLETERLVGNTLVNMYASLGFLATAKDVFDKLPVQDVTSLNALIIGYAERGSHEDVIYCLTQMHHEGVTLNLTTAICCLKACCSIGSILKGREVHIKVVQTGLEQEQLVGNTVIDFYVKFLLLGEAQAVFNRLKRRDIFSWTALMGGYAQLGDCIGVLSLFTRMKTDGIDANLVTFVHVLNACNHSGLVKKGQSYFEAISKDYGLTPEIDHYTCLIDLLGRAGQIDKAFLLIKKMPLHPDLLIWHTVLGACLKWTDVELGRLVFDHAFRLDKRAAATYSYMFSIYRQAGMHKEASKVETMRRENKAWD